MRTPPLIKAFSVVSARQSHNEIIPDMRTSHCIFSCPRVSIVERLHNAHNYVILGRR